MNLNDLLLAKNIDPKQVLVFRHRPTEPRLNKVLGWLASEKPNMFNAYQQTQGERVEKAMLGAAYVASFIGHEAGKALFVGLFSIEAWRWITFEEYWQVPENIELKKFEMRGFRGIEDGRGRSSCRWFDLKQTEFHSEWKGKLIVKWPPPEISWWRRAHNNDMPVLAILEDSAFDAAAALPKWDEMELSWEELGVLPERLKSVLSQWRAIYYIFDASDRKGYVGAAYGDHNLLGRWLDYAASGHGGNKLLRGRDPQNFRFTILQRVSPDMDESKLIQLESTWKTRLHTHPPHGLNDN